MEKNQVVQQQLAEQEIDEESRLKQSRQRVLDRLWEIASLDPEMTRGSMSAQVKAISMIIAIEGLIPDRRAASAQNKPAPPPVKAEIYQAAWLREQREKANSSPTHAQQEAAPEPQPAPALANGSAALPNPTADLTGSTVSAGPSNPTQTASRVPRVPGADFVAPHTRIPFVWHR
jgi:hypothetical protein